MLPKKGHKEKKVEEKAYIKMTINIKVKEVPAEGEEHLKPMLYNEIQCYHCILYRIIALRLYSTTAAFISVSEQRGGTTGKRNSQK